MQEIRYQSPQEMIAAFERDVAFQGLRNEITDGSRRTMTNDPQIQYTYYNPGESNQVLERETSNPSTEVNLPSSRGSRGPGRTQRRPTGPVAVNDGLTYTQVRTESPVPQYYATYRETRRRPQPQALADTPVVYQGQPIQYVVPPDNARRQAVRRQATFEEAYYEEQPSPRTRIRRRQ